MNKFLQLIAMFLVTTSCLAAKEESKTIISKNYENPLALIVTSEGTFTVELFEKECPNTVANFISLAEKGFYKNLSFHRIIQKFMAQGGCPNTRAGASGSPGTGGPGYTFNNESSRSHRVGGLLSMANAGSRFGKGTNGSQFFLTFVPCPWLNGKHTVFGQVIKNKKLLRTLESYGSRRGKVSKKVTFDVKIIRKNKAVYTVKKN